MKLYNTESRTKEEVGGDQKTVRMYTCGPTVYNYAHIGNFRTYVFEDLLRRALKFFGYRVEQVMNITDIDDKTIKGAIKEKVSLKEFTDQYTKAFFEDLESLGIEKVEHYPHATDYIPDMIEIISKLLEEGIAYKGPDGSIYYSIDQFPSYGRLSHLHLCELKKGASVAVDEYDKENVCDFVLWKAYDPERDGTIFWESPFGAGRPGWHIECSTMAMKLLGPSLDIHVGGVDNIFPHHENEIAQSEAYSEERFARLWLHAEHLLVDHKKMSKSLGNFYTLRDLLQKGYTGTEVRYMLLQTHYRTQLNFTFQGLEGARQSLVRFSDFIHRLRSLPDISASAKVDPLLEQADRTFKEALSDDLNISPALAALFDLVREVNILCDSHQIGLKEGRKIVQFLEKCDQVLHIFPFKEEEVPQELTAILERREKARASKDWKEADVCRNQLLERGYLIEDTPSGARLKKKS